MKRQRTKIKKQEITKKNEQGKQDVDKKTLTRGTRRTGMTKQIIQYINF